MAAAAFAARNLGTDGTHHIGLADGARAREQAAILLLVGKDRLIQKRAEVELQVLGVVGKRGPNVFDGHGTDLDCVS